MEPEKQRLDLGRDAALSVDVEEWYHNCWVPEYVAPAQRPPLIVELDQLLPPLLDALARHEAKATFFVLGEVAGRIPSMIRSIAAAGHEVACHGELHLRANEVSVAEFRRDIVGAKERLEELIGAEVVGFRAPEWSLRETGNPRLRIVAEAGFRYDSSLVSAFGAGSSGNPDGPTALRWRDGLTLVELPPLTWAGRAALPAGGWCGRLMGAARVASAAAAAADLGRLPLLVVHPWELVDRPCPGLLTGFARFFHDAARDGFGTRFEELLGRLVLPETLAQRTRGVVLESSRTSRVPLSSSCPGFELEAAKGGA